MICTALVLSMVNAVRGRIICYRGAADDSITSSLFAEAMSARFSDVQEEQENNYLEEEEVSEEEDGEEYNP